MRVVEIDAEATRDLRWRLLRDSRPGADVDFAEDHLPGTWHLGVIDEEGTLVAVATFAPHSTPYRPGARAVQVRGMAVEPHLRRKGLGRMILQTAIERLRAGGVEVLWANGRNGALRFYERLGWEVVGEGFTLEGIPHHVVLKAVSGVDTGDGVAGRANP